MRAWVISDIHHSTMATFWSAPLAIPDADICICAGDISDVVATSIAFLRHNIERRMPVILVLGNHDYFNASIDFALESARQQLEGTRIHLLENQSMEIAGIRFVGATLWTDFSVSVGDDEHIPPEERRAVALGLAPAYIADFHCIFRSDERRKNENGMITARELLARHQISRSFIDRKLEGPFDGRTVVVTHHAPHMASLDPRFFGQATSAAFASDLSDLIDRRKPDVWIHGHIHKFRDYMVDSTRVICNPRGYGGERGISGFRPDFVVDL